MSKPDVTTLQHWFADILVKPGRLPEKLAQADQRWQLDNTVLIKGDEQVPSETRIGVYTTGYMLRLLECMQADLPSLYAFLGEQLFDLFAKGYLIEQPSQSYSLYQLTAGFADFLDRTRPPQNPERPDLEAQYELPGELVRMERARLAVILSKGTEGEAPKLPLDFFSFFTANDIRLKAHPALQLLEQKMPLVQFYQQLMKGESPEIPRLEKTFVAATRLQFRIQFYGLQSWQYRFLEELQKQSEAVLMHDVLHVVAENLNMEKSALLSEFSLWLPNAIQMGLVISDEN